MKGRRTALGVEDFQSFFNHSTDICVEEQTLYRKQESVQMIIVFGQGLISTSTLLKSILPNIQKLYSDDGEAGLKKQNSTERLECKKHKNPQIEQKVQQKVFDGNVAILIEDTIYFYDIADAPKRTPEESITEVSVRGPRDGFIEDLGSNIALIRKRMKTDTLVTKSFVIGRRSQTKVSLVYMTDIQNKAIVDEAARRLEAIDIDFLITDNQLIELLGDKKISLFPLMESISRPDGVISCLARGRFAIFMDNLPSVVIGPANLGLLLSTSEDAHTPYYYATFEMLLRLVGLFVAIFLPAFWVALSAYNVDQIPFPLLATIASSRIGIPFNTTVELILMLSLFEIFREAGVRLPKAVGQTVAVVGGLIVGDAAIRAGLTSPTMLVISSITAVATFTLGNQSLFGTATVLRFGVILFSAVLGMYGFFLSLFLIIAYLAKLESFGISYLSPLAPLSIKGLLKGFVKVPVETDTTRAEMLKVKDATRKPKRRK
ncbi:spore germination protein [Virgibacillus sp. MG-45]|uniref:spore germination protein n=1 Tax=Virgibacillus sp. MG-45 TaxID=3102791 RepID=UPI002ED87D39